MTSEDRRIEVKDMKGIVEIVGTIPEEVDRAIIILHGGAIRLPIPTREGKREIARKEYITITTTEPHTLLVGRESLRKIEVIASRYCPTGLEIKACRVEKGNKGPRKKRNPSSMPAAEAEVGEAGGEIPGVYRGQGEPQDMTKVRAETGEKSVAKIPKTQTTLNHEIVGNDCYAIAVIGAIAKARSREGQGAESTKKILQEAIGIMQRKESAIDRCQVGQQGVREIRRTMTHVIKRIAQEEPKWDYTEQQDAMEAIDKLKCLDEGLPGMGKGVENRYICTECGKVTAVQDRNHCYAAHSRPYYQEDGPLLTFRATSCVIHCYKEDWDVKRSRNKVE